MREMKRFMAYHHDPDLDFNIVQSNWRKLANVEKAKWIRTCYNEEKNMRYCIWLAPSEEELKNIFTEMEVSWESIVEVKETVPKPLETRDEHRMKASPKASRRKK